MRVADIGHRFFTTEGTEGTETYWCAVIGKAPGGAGILSDQTDKEMRPICDVPPSGRHVQHKNAFDPEVIPDQSPDPPQIRTEGLEAAVP